MNEYTKLFDAQQLEKAARPGAAQYFYHGDLELAVNIALAARRPLLVSGSPGCGKSSLAADVAWKLGARYYDEVITSRTQARDLQWSIDNVKRLSDATSKEGLKDELTYLRAGPLWKAFSPATLPPGSKVERGWMDEGKGAVVLLDEIDKAEPDVPNDLLSVIDAAQFAVPNRLEPIKKPRDELCLIVITSNNERALPPAFVRRCVHYEIDQLKQLDAVVQNHFEREQVRPDADLIAAAQTLFTELTTNANQQKVRAPSTAELLDALFACTRLNITSASNPLWQKVAQLALWKHKQPPSPASASAKS